MRQQQQLDSRLYSQQRNTGRFNRVGLSSVIISNFCAHAHVHYVDVQSGSSMCSPTEMRRPSIGRVGIQGKKHDGHIWIELQATSKSSHSGNRFKPHFCRDPTRKSHLLFSSSSSRSGVLDTTLQQAKRQSFPLREMSHATHVESHPLLVQLSRPYTAECAPSEA